MSDRASVEKASRQAQTQTPLTASSPESLSPPCLVHRGVQNVEPARERSKWLILWTLDGRAAPLFPALDADENASAHENAEESSKMTRRGASLGPTACRPPRLALARGRRTLIERRSAPGGGKDGAYDRRKSPGTRAHGAS